MAKPTETSSELAALIRRGDAARFQLGQAHQRFKQKLDIPLRIRDSIKSSPMKWLAGSLAGGLMGSLLFRSGKSAKDRGKKNRGWIVSLLLMSFNLAKPALKIYGAKLLQDYLQHQFARRNASRDVAPRSPS